MKKILISLVTLISFILPQECEEPIDVWFKVSNDENNYGKLLSIDMSRGYAGHYIYLFVIDKNNKEQLVISFPIGYWEIETKSDFVKEMEKEFKDLEDYLIKNKGSGTEIKKEQ